MAIFLKKISIPFHNKTPSFQKLSIYHFSSFLCRMECKLVLNNRSRLNDIPNSMLCGELRQKLNYYKFRRVLSKTGNPVFYLFFRREEDTYHALRVAKSINMISLVRYRHRNINPAPLLKPDDIPPSEMQYRPIPPQNIVDIIRYNFRQYIDQFVNKV